MELEQRRATVQRAARTFGAVNLGIGTLGLFGPAVENDRDELLNTAPGYLLGFAGVNGTHALLHLGVGAFGLAAGRSERASVAYMRGVAVTFGLMAAMGARKVRGREGLYDVMGMTVSKQSNWIHAGWAVFGAAFSRTLEPRGREPGDRASSRGGRRGVDSLPTPMEGRAVSHGSAEPVGEG